MLTVDKIKSQIKVTLVSIKYALMREMLNKTSFIMNILFMIINNASFLIHISFLEKHFLFQKQ